MTDSNKAPRTIWGTFPAPSADEVEKAWGQILVRHQTDVANGVTPLGGSLADRVRLTEFMQASPALFNHLDLLGRRFVDVTGNVSDAKAYKAGMADLVEVLGTVAMNRQVDALEAQLPPTDTGD